MVVVYKELKKAIDLSLKEIHQDDDFKMAFRKLIENAMEDNYREQDIMYVIGLITTNSKLGEEGEA